MPSAAVASIQTSPRCGSSRRSAHLTSHPGAGQRQYVAHSARRQQAVAATGGGGGGHVEQKLPVLLRERAGALS